MKRIIVFLLSIVLLVNINAQEWEYLESGTDFILFDLSFPAGQSNVGYVVGSSGIYNGDGIMLKTIDGGDTWNQILPAFGEMDALTGVFFTSIEVGYIVGWNDYVAKTIDGGETWTQLSLSNEGREYLDIEFWDENNGIAFCSTPMTWDTYVYVTDDAGATWTAGTTGVYDGFGDMAYMDANTVFAVGFPDQKIWKSEDGGLTWALNHSGYPFMFLIGVDFEGDFGVAVGELGDCYVTNNGGDSWTLTAQNAYLIYEAVDVIDSETAYFGGNDEEMFKTSDAGVNWDEEFNGNSFNHIYAIEFTESGIGFAVMSGGKIIRKAPAFFVDFYADQTEVCIGETVQFTNASYGDISWAWTFEGGTPETSTEENPTVVYNEYGIFNVELTISDGSQTVSILKEDFITTMANLEPVIIGEELVCIGHELEYTVTQNFESTYNWTVVGGIITQGQGTNIITVLWNELVEGNILVSEEGPIGCSGDSELFEVLIDECTGLASNKDDSGLTIYPNPVIDFINVEINSSSYLELSIYNSLGQIEFQKIGSRQSNNKIEQINISKLNKGIYVIRVKLPDNKVVTKRFVKN